MTRVLLITNDFPPRPGGIESYLRDFVACLAPEDVTVLASSRGIASEELKAYDGSQPYRVVRLPDRIMLPLPHVLRAALEIIRREHIETVWFGAAAPMGLLAPALRRAGVRRIVATTHGHEVGWSMVPGARRCLRIIGNSVDVVTYISAYTRHRIAAAFGPQAAFERLPSAVDVDRFQPDTHSRKWVRQRHGLDSGVPLVVCISRLVTRKGQDSLIKALPLIAAEVPDVRLMIVGVGGRRKALEELAEKVQLPNGKPARTQVIFTGAVDAEHLPAYYAAGDVFAMPARTRGGGLDVEGLGIVYLEAQAAGVPVIAGNSGGAPETIVDGETGYIVDGRNIRQLAERITGLLLDPAHSRKMREAGRRHVSENWTWDVMGAQLRSILRGIR